MYKVFLISVIFLLSTTFVNGAIPTPSPLPASPLNIYYFDGIIGQPSYDQSVTTTIPTAASLTSPISVYSTPRGVYVADYSDKRVLFYSNPISSEPEATEVFGQPNLTTSAADVFEEVVSVVTDGEGSLFAVDYAQSRILKYLSGSNQTLKGSLNPDIALGVATRPQPGEADSHIGTSMAGASTIFRSLSSPKQIAVDPQYNLLYVADDGNNRVLRFPAGIRAEGGPTGVIGAADYIVNSGCTETDARTCLTSPSAVAVDCHSGVWVATRVSGMNQIYWFAKATQLAKLAISPPDDNPNDFDDIWSLSFDATCRYLAVSTGSKARVYIIEISFNEAGVPQPPSSAVIIGSVSLSEGLAAPSNSSDSLGPVYSTSWDAVNPGRLYIADYFNHRVVAVNPFTGTQLPSPSPMVSSSNNPIMASASSNPIGISSSVSISPTPAVGTDSSSDTSPSHEPVFASAASGISSWLSFFAL